jgi:hypothetical protein
MSLIFETSGSVFHEKWYESYNTEDTTTPYLLILTAGNNVVNLRICEEGATLSPFHPGSSYVWWWTIANYAAIVKAMVLYNIQ